MLKGKKALVTGATRGIGRATALAFAKAGADVAIIATKESDASRNLVEEINALGVNCVFIPCDISDRDQADRTVDETIKALGGIDILVNNAGITSDKLLMSMTEDDFCRVIDVNLKGCFHMTRACIRPMIKQKGGRIINISSVVGLMGNAGQTNYAASKAGVIGFSKSVAKEYASRGITCNCIAPGFICTDMTDAMTDAAKEAVFSQIPMKRMGDPEDIASCALFLASDMASYITGEVIKVDGGMYI